MVGERTPGSAADVGAFLAQVVQVTPASQGDLRRTAGAPGFDWTRTIDVARAHGVLALLDRALRTAGAEAVPPAVARQVQELAAADAVRAMALTGELVRVCRALAEANVTAVAYKGPTLAEAAYGSIALRDFCDIDLVIRPGDVERARAVMAALGYASPAAPPRSRDLFAVWSVGQLEFARGDRLVELHWELAPRLMPFDLEGPISRAGAMELGGIAIAVFHPDDLVLMLCIHGAKHAWERLAWCRDVAGLVARSSIDWPSVMRRASAAGAARILATGLLLATSTCGATLPADVRAWCERDGHARVLAHRLARELLEAPAERGRWHDARFHWRSREHLADRLAFVVRLLTTPLPVDWETFRLPSRLQPFYPVLRPAGLVWRELHRMFTPSARRAP